MQRNQEQAEWIDQERQLFHTNWDRNADGKLDRAELADWMMPVGVDYADNEAIHLITTADDDKVCSY
jgi:Ca2+-binding EF-hand superfamily protein